MPKPPAPPLPSSVTSGQLARLIGRTERVINGRKADGRLPLAPGGGIDLAAVVQAGVSALARQGRDPAQADREACSLAAWAVECAVSAMAAPQSGEDPPAAAARGLARALHDDDFFDVPADWKPPTRIEPAPGLLMTAAEEAAIDAAGAR